MRARRPSFDFSDTPARWAREGEFAQQMNASSLWIPYLERFLNRVMAQAAAKLNSSDPKAAKIKADIRMFIRQEANHYSLHGAFNEILPRSGYDVAVFEKHFEAEFERLYTTKSFKFLLAYCEGFETLGPPMALVWLDEIEDLLEGADSQVVGLWKWHLMEEYEHRSVCSDVFKAFGGGYFMRIYGLFYQLRHLGGFSKMVREHLFERDSAGKSEEEIAIMRQRAEQVKKKVIRLALPRILKALSPFYDPKNSPEPKAYRRHMAKVEASLG
jgi:predicted metal-dependent hydrolase